MLFLEASYESERCYFSIGSVIRHRVGNLWHDAAAESHWVSEFSWGLGPQSGTSDGWGGDRILCVSRSDPQTLQADLRAEIFPADPSRRRSTAAPRRSALWSRVGLGGLLSRTSACLDGDRSPSGPHLCRGNGRWDVCV